MDKGTVSSKGQLVIPAKIREKLAIEEGTEVIFIETERGVEIVTKKRMLEWLRGCVKGKVSLDDFLEMRREEHQRELEKMKRWEAQYMSSTPRR
jgi:AbrB family looped-hinge helix DNA binding protein